MVRAEDVRGGMKIMNNREHMYYRIKRKVDMKLVTP